jgi:DNA-binding CsgD family transcriptional regulator
MAEVAARPNPLGELLDIFKKNGVYCLGICATNAWISWVNNADSFNSLSSHLVDSGAMLAMLVIAVCVCWRWDIKKSGEERFDWPIAILMSISTFFVSSIPFHTSFTLGAIAVGEVGMAWCWLRWGRYLSMIDLRGVIACVFGSYILSCVVRVFLSSVPVDMAVFLASLLPFVSIFALRRSLRTVPEKVPQVSPVTSSPQKSWGPLLLVSACFFVIRFINILAINISSDPMLPSLSSFSNIAELGVSVFILYYIFVRKSVFEFRQLWPILIFFLATALLLFSFTGFGVYSTYLLDITGSILVMFLWVTLADISHHSVRHVYVVFAIGRIAYTLPTLILAPIFYQIDLTSHVSLLLALSNYIMLIFTAFFFGKRNTLLSQVFSDLEEKPCIEAFAQIKERCLEIGKRYNLTNREIEIISYSCQGRSRAYIAETLFISANTVKSHTQRIYMKLGIHRKSELQKLLDL